MFDTGPRPDLWGDPVAPAAATRIVVVTPQTRYVNVVGGETIRFLVGDKAFGWRFTPAQHIPPFDLRIIAPPGMLDHQVLVYVAIDARYLPGW
jgi:hypothetical protein